jgi:hypothetical protein
MAKPIDTQGVVRCTRLEVVDDDDVVRAVLYCTNDDPGCDRDAVCLELRDPKGRDGFSVMCNHEVATAELWKGGNAALAASVAYSGAAVLEMLGPDGRRGWRIDNTEDGG